MGRILKIRLLQFYQILLELGLLRVFFLLGLLIFALFYLFSNVSKGENIDFVSGFFILLVLSIHLKRKDKAFLYINVLNPYKIFLIEYLLVSSPIMVLLFYFGFWQYALIIITFLIFISFVKIGIRIASINTKIQEWIPNDNFEWKSGVRRNLLVFIPLYLVGLTTSFYPASVPVILLILTVVILNFYDNPEPVDILISKELAPKPFLKEKLLKHLITYFIFSLPLVILFMVFNAGYYYIILFEYIVLSILLLYSILLKYAYYRPNVKSGATKIFTNIGVLSILVPFLLPIVLVLIIKFAFQANQNLKFYLDDYNQ
jgi:hypothetical protein